MSDWLVALITFAACLLLAMVLGPLTRKLLSKPSRPDAVRQIAPAAGTFVFSALLAVGLIGALSTVDPTGLKKIPTDFLQYFPKLLVAGFMVLLGNVGASVASITVRRAAIQATGSERPTAVRVVKAAIMGTAVILAVGQLGVNTTIINLAVAALVFSIGATITLLIGLGGRDVARQVGAGRYVQRVIKPGQRLRIGDVAGVVTAVHAASVEIDLGGGRSAHLPHAAIIESIVEVDHPTSDVPSTGVSVEVSGND
jgi:hypothetical protein